MTDVLSPGEIALYLARPDLTRAAQRASRHASVLTGEERARIARYRFEDDRDEHFVTRLLVRTALSRHRPVAPDAWRFLENEHGRPEIHPPCGLRFNASNSHGLVACAVAERAEVGIDVEPHSRAGQILEVATTVFSDAELEELRALGADVGPGRTRGSSAAPGSASGSRSGSRSDGGPRRERRARDASHAPEAACERAVALWTLKEAYIKARGIGLGLPLRRMTLAFAPDGGVALAADRDVDPDPSRWRFHRIDLLDHGLAIAVECPTGANITVRPPITLLED